MHIPRYPFDLAARAQGRLSPRKRGDGRFGMTRVKDLAPRVNSCHLNLGTPNSLVSQPARSAQ
jgi:hypothetical protein